MASQPMNAETGMIRRDEMAGMEVSRSAETAMGAAFSRLLKHT